ncbi:MAG: hypothetical protein HC873_04990 [Leptolyngbyaceae cyanobacterium SL_1_1]|nr:hypothetical protein [Leptolyngbyaceae cyanobacterium RM1_1_2]NJO09112.1 hypothetical protein [Leptolyngbyaceae cyanobacterium SL_1_1]
MNSIEETVEKIFSTRRLTRYDQRLLMSLYAKRQISRHDQALIARIYEALNQGRIRVVE